VGGAEFLDGHVHSRLAGISHELSKVSDGHWPLMGEALSLLLDTLDFMERVGFEVAFSAVRTRDHRNIFNHEKIFAFAVGPCDLSNSDAALSANITRHCSSF
jgi:hypothetical protein